MNERVDLDILYPHPPERVWKALTDSEALRQWLMPTDFKPLIGFRFRLDLPSGGQVVAKVTDVEAERLLAYTWTDEEDGQASLVVWSLEPQDGGTRVRLQHLPLEEPAVTCLTMDRYFNWLYALRHGLPGMLRLLQAMEAPMVVFA